MLDIQALYPENIAVCLPESFEWLILNSGLVDDAKLEGVLRDTSAYVESSEYESWEQFFTAYLQRIAEGTHFAYHKGKLSEAYKLPQNTKRIVAQISRGNVQ